MSLLVLLAYHINESNVRISCYTVMSITLLYKKAIIPEHCKTIKYSCRLVFLIGEKNEAILYQVCRIDVSNCRSFCKACRTRSNFSQQFSAILEIDFALVAKLSC